MSIIFEPVVSSAGVDSGRAVGLIRSGGIDAGESTGMDFGAGGLFLQASASDDAGGDLVITIPDGGGGSLLLSSSGSDGGSIADAGGSKFHLVGGGYDLHPGQDAGIAAIGIRAYGYESPPVRAYAYMVAPDPSFLAYAGLQYERAAETAGFFNVSAGTVTAALRDRIGMALSPKLALTGLSFARDTVELGDALAVISRVLAEEGFDTGASVAANYTAVTRIADALRMSGVASTALDAVNLVVAGVAFRSMADMFAKEQLLDGMQMGAVVDDVLRAAARLVDQILLGGEIANSMQFGAVVHEGIHLSSGIAGAAELMARLHEGIELAVHLNVEGEQATAYVLNTELGAAGATTYQNYPFNSFARIGGEHGEQYGMTPDGIRRIGGTSDAGQPIHAAARLAMGNLGTGVAKRMQAAYLGYASNGDIRLKAVVVNSRDGAREAWCYRMLAMPGEDTQQARIQIGQGLKSVYWSFALESIDGSAFTVDLIDLHPLVLDQRMLGQGGGRR